MAASANVAQAVNTAGNAYVSAQATRAQGEYQKKMSDLNARTAEGQAEDAIKRGNIAALEKTQETRRAIGAQRAALAAGGVDVNSDIGLNLQAETEAIGASDAQKIRANAWREAWGYKADAVTTRGAGEMANYAAQNTARSTLITGGIEAATYGLKAADEYKKKSPSKTTKGTT